MDVEEFEQLFMKLKVMKGNVANLYTKPCQGCLQRVLKAIRVYLNHHILTYHLKGKISKNLNAKSSTCMPHAYIKHSCGGSHSSVKKSALLFNFESQYFCQYGN